MSETERKRLIVKGPGGFEKAVGWINMPPKGAKGGGSRKKKIGSVTQGQTFDTREMEGQVQEGVHTWSEAGGARASWSDDSSEDEPIVRPTKGIRSSKKRKKGEKRRRVRLVGQPRWDQQKLQLEGRLRVGLKLVGHKGPGAQGRRRESGSRPSKKRRK
jgi:hypothetical protein